MTPTDLDLGHQTYWVRLVCSALVLGLNAVLLRKNLRDAAQYRGAGINGPVSLIMRQQLINVLARLACALAGLLTSLPPHPPRPDLEDVWFIALVMAGMLVLSVRSFTVSWDAQVLAGEELRTQRAHETQARESKVR